MRRTISNQPFRRTLTIGFVGVAFSVYHISTAYCMEATNKKISNDQKTGKSVNTASTSNDQAKSEINDAEMNTMVDAIMPLLGQLTYGSVLGGCAGYAAKKMTRTAALAIGGTFLFLQALAWQGYIFVDWQKIQGDVVSKLDQDGDGDFDGDDVRIIIQNLWGFVKFQIPSYTGFGSGFLAGFKYG